jgi:hypothetical protein
MSRKRARGPTGDWGPAPEPIIQVITDPRVSPGRWFLFADPAKAGEWLWEAWREMCAQAHAEAIYGPCAACEGMGV